MGSHRGMSKKKFSLTLRPKIQDFPLRQPLEAFFWPRGPAILERIKLGAITPTTGGNAFEGKDDNEISSDYFLNRERAVQANRLT